MTTHPQSLARRERAALARLALHSREQWVSLPLSAQMRAVARAEPLTLDARGMSPALTPESAFSLVQERWTARVQAWAVQVAHMEARLSWQEGMARPDMAERRQATSKTEGKAQ